MTIESRATDDSGNIETPSAGVSVTVNCPCGLFGQNYTPAVTPRTTPRRYELGVKFQSSVPGWVAGVRFYKGAGNTGPTPARLWTPSGTQLATGTFTNETASGWQTLTFANPVQISANTTYVVSYYAPNGHYAADGDLFDSAAEHARRSPRRESRVHGVPAAATASTTRAAPASRPRPTTAPSYGVDVIFDTTQPPGQPPTVTSVTPYPGSSSNPVSTRPRHVR